MDKKRQQMNRQITLEKLASAKTMRYQGKESPLFDDSDLKIDHPKAISEGGKRYLNMLSELDNIDPYKEYIEAGQGKRSKVSDTPSLLINDDEEYDDFAKKFIKPPSRLDKECQGSDVIAEVDGEDKHEDIWDNDDYLLSDSGNHIPIMAEEKPSIPAIQAKVHPIQNNHNNEPIDLAYAIAEDFATKKNLIIVGGVIHIYNGRFYSMLNGDEAERLIFQQYREEISRVRSPVTVTKNAATLLRYSISKVFDEFPVNPQIIVFENGTLEVDTGRFRKNSPADLASSALGINYNPNRWEMPHTEKFLKTIANGDDDQYELMLQSIGYILSNDNKAKSFFYLEGVGDAGKSRFCDLIASFFPTSGANKVARIALQDLGGKFALGNLVNAKLNISEDLPDSPLSAATVSKIKMISDSNRQEAEAKYVQPFSFRPQCKLLFASNHSLRLKEHDAAFVNRVVYIPFLHAIPKHRQDPMILEKMQRELPALFNHAFAAYKRLVANGYEWAGADRFKPEICIVSSGLSLNKEQVLKRFVDTCCMFEEDAITPTAELQCAYQRFCQENNYLPIMGDRFSRELKNVLPSTVTRIKIGNQQRGFKGISL